MKSAIRIGTLIVGSVSCLQLSAQIQRGEVNGDGVLDISDSVAALRFLFIGDFTPVCLDAADSNDDDKIDISDAVFSLAFLFLGGPAPDETPPDCEPQCGLPPFDTPDYSRPANDGIALESLLEGAGYGASTNSDWVDIASGNVCGGPEKELILIKNRHSYFSIMGGPTPYAIAGLDLDSNPAHPWRAVAAGNLDADPFHEIIALRHVTAAEVPDVLVYKIGPSACDVASLAATLRIGNAGNSDWLDAAVGNFDGSGNQVALLKSDHVNCFLLELSGAKLEITLSSDLATVPSYPWTGLAAGDLDQDGIDELIAARHVSDGNGATVIAYKWIGSDFQPIASSTFGNNGNSQWAGITAGDFNGDGRAAIGLVKNNHSNFAILDLPTSSTTLRELATSDLDSASGQGWRGVTATDWLGGDLGADELVAVRAAEEPYRADLFVYGNQFHRAQRDSALVDRKAQYDQQRGESPETLVALLAETHTDTINWGLVRDDDYPALVEFLQGTANTCVDGKQLRVAITLVPIDGVPDVGCSLPVDVDGTPWNELDFFSPPNGDPFALCKDSLGWASLIGRLARDYPHLVSLGIDDFTHYLDDYNEELVAQIQSRMRQQAPWLTFVPTTYYGDLDSNPPDLAQTLDTFLYYFRNEKENLCLSNPCGEESVQNAPGELERAAASLPAGRKLQVGTYWGHYGSVDRQFGTGRYNYDLVRLIRNLPYIGGVTAYPMQVKTSNFVPCDEFNFLDVIDENKFCALEKAYVTQPQPVSHVDLTSASGARPATGNPFAYVFAGHEAEVIVYRATDGNIHELTRSPLGLGHSNLAAAAGAPLAVGDPMGYVFAAHDVQNVVYRGTDNHVHGLYWSFGAVGHDDLSALANAPAAAGAPYGYVFDVFDVQNVLYRGVDGHLHGLYWSRGDVGHDDLTVLSGAPGPAADPFGYIFGAAGKQTALYRGTDGHLHGLHWARGEVGHDDLTALSGAPAPAGIAKAYIATTYGVQYAVYRGVDGHLHGLYWAFGNVGHDDLTLASHAPVPVGDPTGYFVEADGRHHVVYRSDSGQVRHLSWTTGVVSHDNLTLLARAPNAAGDPTAYLAADGRTQHVIYRSDDGHLHDLVFGN